MIEDIVLGKQSTDSCSNSVRVVPYTALEMDDIFMVTEKCLCAQYSAAQSIYLYLYIAAILRIRHHMTSTKSEV